MQPGAAGDQATVGRVEALAGVIADAAARLFHQHETGGQIPGRQAPLPVAIEPASGHIGQIQGCRSGSPHPSGAVGEPGELGVIVIETAAAVVGKACGQQRFRQLLAAAHRQGLVVAPGSQARRGPEGLLQGWRVQRPDQGQALPGEANGRGEEGEAVGVVGGAIEGIDTPFELAGAGPAATFLSQDCQSWRFSLEHRQHGHFSRLIGLRDQITGPALFADPFQPPAVVPQHGATGAGRAAGHRRQLFQLRWAEATAQQGGAGQAEVVHSSSRGRPGRTLPRPKWRPNWRS